ncbi:MAG: hypothetical protein U0U09_18605 [Cyclobacteriaceae bacterium]
MKSFRLQSLFIVGALAFFASCGGDDDNKKTSKGTYYIEFKMNGGDLIRFEAEEPGYQACGSCACSTLPPTALEGAGLYVCNESEDFSANDIENLENSSLMFTADDFPNALFAFGKDGVNYSSDYAPDQVGSFTVTKVVSDGDFFGSAQYKVTGTFECIVRADGDDTDIAITEGKFVVRFSEN